GAPCRRGVRHVLGAGSGPEVSGVHAGAVVASVPEVQPNDTHAEHLASNDVRSPDAPLVSVGPIRDDLAIAQADREASTAPQPAARIRLGVDLLPEPGREAIVAELYEGRHSTITPASWRRAWPASDR